MRFSDSHRHCAGKPVGIASIFTERQGLMYDISAIRLQDVYNDTLTYLKVGDGMDTLKYE
jgi:hypothetical protein